MIGIGQYIINPDYYRLIFSYLCPIVLMNISYEIIISLESMG